MGVEAEFLKLVKTYTDGRDNDTRHMSGVTHYVVRDLHHSLPKSTPTHTYQAEYALAHIIRLAVGAVYDVAKRHDAKDALSDPAMVASMIFEDIGMRSRKLGNEPENHSVLFSMGRVLFSQAENPAILPFEATTLNPSMALAQAALRIIASFPQTFDASLVRYPQEDGYSKLQMDQGSYRNLSSRTIEDQKFDLAAEFPSLKDIIFPPAQPGAPEAFPAP